MRPEEEQFKYKPREWQLDGFENCHSANITSGHQFVDINAGVGSGKTDVGSYAIYDWIKLHPNHTTVSMFIAPTINLCKQQEESVVSFVKDMLSRNTRVATSSVVPIQINSASPDNKDIDDLINLEEGYHYIITVCKPSYFGEKKYYPFWGEIFRAWVTRGFSLGCRVYDEAHNYKSKADLIVGGYPFFHADVLMSGTPDKYQTSLETNHRANCTVQNSMSHGWTVMPKLVYVKADWKSQFGVVLKQLLKSEIKLSQGESMQPRMMVCCSNIPQVWNIANMKYFAEGTGEYFNIISIHSERGEYKPLVNGKPVSSKEAMMVVSALDKGSDSEILKEYNVNPSLLTIVLQVDMISEGINVKSFNSVVVTTDNHRKGMQQFGRVFRNYDKGEYSKRLNGHATAYVVQEDIRGFQAFMGGLKEKYEVDFRCFKF